MSLYTFNDQVRIFAPKAWVFARLWDVERWPALLPHVAAVEILEQRPGYQRFSMQTHGEHALHRTESTRESASSDCIRYEQVVLPPLLRIHRGRWLLDAEADGAVVVTAEHTLELEPSQILPTLGREYTLQEAQLLSRHAIGNHSVKTLTIIGQIAASARDQERA